MNISKHLLDTIKRDNKIWYLPDMIKSVKRKTSKNPALLEVAIPDDLAEILLKQLVSFSIKVPIRGLRLEWDYHPEDDEK